LGIAQRGRLLVIPESEEAKSPKTGIAAWVRFGPFLPYQRVLLPTPQSGQFVLPKLTFTHAYIDPILHD
jgi:hypothetical protein